MDFSEERVASSKIDGQPSCDGTTVSVVIERGNRTCFKSHLNGILEVFGKLSEQPEKPVGDV